MQSTNFLYCNMMSSHNSFNFRGVILDHEILTIDHASRGKSIAKTCLIGSNLTPIIWHCGTEQIHKWKMSLVITHLYFIKFIIKFYISKLSNTRSILMDEV